MTNLERRIGQALARRYGRRLNHVNQLWDGKAYCSDDQGGCFTAELLGTDYRNLKIGMIDYQGCV